MISVLHYIYDLFCGWCYGAAPLLEAAESIEGLKIELHAGGMLTGERRQRVTPQFRNFVMNHDARIAQLSGQPFSAAYRDGLLQDTTAVFDSEPPTTAILAAGERGLDMLKRIQKAHFEQGQRVADVPVLMKLASELGLADFPSAYEAAAGEPTSQHIADSQDLLSRAGGQGFPTILLETGHGAFQVDHGPYLGKVDEWRKRLRESLQPVGVK